MLVLSRKRGESIHIGDDIVIEIIEISLDKVRIGITAPKNVPVHRAEIYQLIQKAEPVSADLPPSEKPDLSK